MLSLVQGGTLNFLPPFFYAVSALVGLLFVIWWHKRGAALSWRAHHFFVVLAGVVFSFRILYALGLSILQYYAWKTGPVVSGYLLSLPVDNAIPGSSVFNFFGGLLGDPNGYFLFYIFGRFWLGLLIIIVTAFLWCGFLRTVNAYDARIIDKDGLCACFASVAIVGWPGFVIYLPLLFIFAFFHALINKYRFGIDGVGLELSSFIAALFLAVAGVWLLPILGLSVLII